MHIETRKFDYEVVKLDSVDDLSAILSDWASRGWKYVGDYKSMGYTTRLIFERPVVAR